MESDYFIETIKLNLSATRTAYIIGKFDADASKVSTDEIGEIDLQFIEAYRELDD